MSAPIRPPTRTWRELASPTLAQLDYREVLKRAPNDLDALNNIAWVRATHVDAQHRDGAEAVRLAEQASRMN